MYALSLGLVKQTIFQLFAILARNSGRVYAVYVAMGTNLVFTVVWIFAIAFQCPLPDASHVFSSQCFDQVGPWLLRKNYLILIVGSRHFGKHLQQWMH